MTKTRWIHSLLVTGALVASLATNAPAQQRIDGDSVAERTISMMTEIDWHNSLEPLMSIAVEQKKPIFWLQIVGELDGDL